jgi:hypothetical protein
MERLLCIMRTLLPFFLFLLVELWSTFLLYCTVAIHFKIVQASVFQKTLLGLLWVLRIVLCGNLLKVCSVCSYVAHKTR